MTFLHLCPFKKNDCVFRGDELKVIFCFQMKYHLVARNGVFNFRSSRDFLPATESCMLRKLQKNIARILSHRFSSNPDWTHIVDVPSFSSNHSGDSIHFSSVWSRFVVSRNKVFASVCEFLINKVRLVFRKSKNCKIFTVSCAVLVWD